MNFSTPMQRMPAALAGLALAIAVSGCAQDSGATAETRPLDKAVTSVRSNGDFNLKIVHGDSPALTLRGSPSQLARIITQQNGSQLTIDCKGRWLVNTLRGWIFGDSAMETVEITVPALEKVSLQGSGNVHISGFRSDRLELGIEGAGDVDVSGRYAKLVARIHGTGNVRSQDVDSEEVNVEIAGTGNVALSGQTKAMTAKIAGTGNLEAHQLLADSVEVTVMGVGNARVFAKQSANAAIMGVGDIRVFGDPPQRKSNSAGVGVVIFEPSPGNTAK